MRFVVDTAPAEDELVETEVLRDTGAGGGADKVALVDLEGLIVDAERGRLLGGGENPVSTFTESLERAEKDRRVKGVLVRVNSPGGTVTASDMVYREILQFKERSGKPVVVLMGEVAASGGYYVSCAADEILAYPTTITGSIGVIIQTFNFTDGMHKIGIHADAITSGPNKAMGSPFQPMPAEQRALLQGIVDEFYANFLGVVETGRGKLTGAELRKWIADGRVITGARAAEVGVVDGLGDLRSAFDAAKRRARIDAARLVKYHRPIEHVGSAYAAAPAGAQLNLFQLNLGVLPGTGTGFYYLWDPSLW
jgi:protease-4